MRKTPIVIGIACAAALVAAPTVHAVDRPQPAAGPTNQAKMQRALAEGTHSRFAVPGLDQQVVDKYTEYVRLGADGHFRAEIPADVAAADPQGARTARRSVTSANDLIDRQRAELARRGDHTPVTARRASAAGAPTAVLPMGEHATFQAEWWGMTFTLDATATKGLTDALEATKDVQKLLDALGAVGIVIAPEVGTIVQAVLKGLTFIQKAVASNTTADGLVIKALWVPVPWTEKPKGPFKPAPAGLRGVRQDPAAVPGAKAPRTMSVVVG